MGVSVEIMQVRRYFLQYIMHMTVFNVIMQVTLSFIAIYVTGSSSNFIFLSLTDSLCQGILSVLHSIAFVHILPKLIYFDNRSYIQIGNKSYSVLFFPIDLWKVGTSWISSKWGNLRQRAGIDLKKGVMTPSYQLCRSLTNIFNI